MTEDNDPQDAEINRLRKENQALREENQDLKDEVQRLRRKITELEDLVKQMKTTPQHLAASEDTAEAGGIPSSQTFYKKNRNPDNTPTGAQPGHEGHAQDTPNAPPLCLELDACPDCGHGLGEPSDVMACTVPDIPEPRATIYEVQRPRYWCPGCKERKHRDNPLPYQRYGVNLAAWTTHQRLLGLSPGKIRENAAETWDIHLSDGAILGMTSWVADALGPAYEQIEAQAQDASVAGGDETGFRIDGTNGWMWVAQALDAVVDTIADTRGQAVPEELFEEFEGVLVRDGWRAMKPWTRLTISCAGCTSTGGSSKPSTATALSLGRCSRTGPSSSRARGGRRSGCCGSSTACEPSRGTPSSGSRATRTQAGRFQTELIEHVTRGWTQEDAVRIAGTLERYLERDEVFTFVRVPGVPWHNNASERAIRKGVHHRKVSGGRRSWQGARRLEVLLSVYETCKQQGESFRALVRDALVPEGFCNSSSPGALPQS
jgi:transposase